MGISSRLYGSAAGVGRTTRGHVIALVLGSARQDLYPSLYPPGTPWRSGTTHVTRTCVWTVHSSPLAATSARRMHTSTVLMRRESLDAHRTRASGGTKRMGVRGAEKGGMAVVDTPAWISRDGEARALTPPAQTIAQFANRALAR
jgi:hypothetical protein